MKNPRVIPLLVAFMFAVMCGFVACDGDDDDTDNNNNNNNTQNNVTPPAFSFNISAACEATDGSGNVISQLDLVAGQTVTYTNNWNAQSEVKFSVAGFVPGGTTLTLQAGETVTHVVESTVVDGDYQWSLICQNNAAPAGGGPVKVDNPPPGP